MLLVGVEIGDNLLGDLAALVKARPNRHAILFASSSASIDDCCATKQARRSKSHCIHGAVGMLRQARRIKEGNVPFWERNDGVWIAQPPEHEEDIREANTKQ